MGLGKKIKSLFKARPADLMCYAPLNNMLIDQQGNVQICCHHSNDFTIGKFPEQSMHDIWFGDVRQRMVAEMRAGRVPSPCLECVKNGINDQSPDSKIRTSKSFGLGSVESFPQQIELLLGNECNLSCIMCGSNKQSTIRLSGVNESAISFGEDFLRQMQPFFEKVKFVVFSGGEPFVIPIYRDIWSYLHKYNPSAGMYVQTNGTVLNSTIKKLLSDYSIQVGVSVDALTPAIYERIRIHSNAGVLFENLKYFMQYSIAQGNHMGIMMTPMILNAGEVPGMLEYCNSHELVFSLSILNWPYSLAIWALPAEKIGALLQLYRSMIKHQENLSPLVARNHLVYSHFVKLVGDYYKTRLAAEKNKKQLVELLILQAKAYKSTFLKQVAVTPVEVPVLGETFAEWLSQYAMDLQICYKEDLICDEFVYFVFRGKKLEYFINLHQKENPENLLTMGKKRLEELLFLAAHDCYERLGVEVHLDSESNVIQN